MAMDFGFNDSNKYVVVDDPVTVNNRGGNLINSSIVNATIVGAYVPPTYFNNPPGAAGNPGSAGAAGTAGTGTAGYHISTPINETIDDKIRQIAKDKIAIGHPQAFFTDKTADETRTYTSLKSIIDGLYHSYEKGKEDATIFTLEQVIVMLESRLKNTPVSAPILVPVIHDFQELLERMRKCQN